MPSTGYIKSYDLFKYRNGVITINDLLRDLTNEKEAKQTQRLHELEKLEDLYELKATLNQ